MEHEATTKLDDEAGEGTCAHRIEGIVVGMLAGFAEDGTPLVLFAGNPSTTPARARTTATLSPGDTGCRVAIAFEDCSPTAPVILGRLQEPPGMPASAEIDGRATLELEAEREVVIRCGKASITLTRAGKVLIRGTYVFSRSSGVNKIKGGSVELN